MKYMFTEEQYNEIVDCLAQMEELQQRDLGHLTPILLDDISEMAVIEALTIVKEQYEDAVKDDPDDPVWVKDNRDEAEAYGEIIKMFQ